MTEKEINQRLMHASVVEAHLAACQQELAECKRIIEEAQKQEPVAIASMPWCRLEWLIGDTITWADVRGLCVTNAKLYRAPIPAQQAAGGRDREGDKEVAMQRTGVDVDAALEDTGLSR